MKMFDLVIVIALASYMGYRGYRNKRIALASGITGTTVAFLMIWYSDWFLGILMIVYGLAGFTVVFGIYAIIGLVVGFIARMLSKS
jgi:hypothetical protein